MSSVVSAIGLVSRTSMDGIDVALVATDGEQRLERRRSLTFPYSAQQRARLREAAAATSRSWGGKGEVALHDQESLTEVMRELTHLHAAAVKAFLENCALARDVIALVGFHGQPVKQDASREPGDGELLARLIGIDVIYDFCSADLSAGGRGRPMVPVYHRALAEQAGIARPLAVVEIGSVASLTFIGDDGALIALEFETAVTAPTLEHARESLPARPLVWLLAGEAARDATLLATLSGLLAEPVYRADEMGWPNDYLEAEAFAYLAVRSMRKLPLSFPGTTGVRHPVTGGRLAKAPRR